MKIALVGWGVETKSAFRYFGLDHEYLIVNEEPASDFPSGENIKIQYVNAERKPGLTGNSDDLSYLEGIEEYEKIISTPVALKTLEKVYPNEHAIWQNVTTTMQIFFENTKSKNIVGITGTKGKGTTSTLIAKMIEASGQKTHLIGNIGVPMLDELNNIDENDWVVIEMSNFQLYKFPYSPHIAVHLMMMPEHIDEWHKTMDDYAQAKRNIFAHQTSQDIAIYHAHNQFAKANAHTSPGKLIPYLSDPGAIVKGGNITIDNQAIIAVNEVGLLGEHNIENICAAVTAVWQIMQDIDPIRRVIAEFKGLEHRLQLIAELNGVKYYDDSFGTTPDTAIVAMNSFTQPKVMIVGGHDKGNDMQPVIERLKLEDIRNVIGIGPVGLHIVQELQKDNQNKTLYTKENCNDWTMEEIVTRAKAEAESGDIVLLSAGTSSFGIFKDYKDRGNQFITEVNKLKKTLERAVSNEQ